MQAENTFNAAIDYCSEKRPYLCLFILCGILYFLWITAEPLRSHIEANRVQASYEMLKSGDWVVPTLNGEAYLAKPPLQYWIISLLSLPWGEVTLFIARSLSAVCVLLTLWLTFWLAKTQLTPRLAFFSCVILALSPLIIEKGPRAELEAPLMLATTSAIIFLWRASQSSTYIRWMLASGAALGCAVLIKGPVPWLVFSTAWIGLAIGVSNRKRVAACGAAALFISILFLAPWGLALLSRFGWEQLRDTLYWEVFERTVSKREIVQEPFWYYIKSLAKGLFPWSLLAPGLYFLPWRSQEKRAFFWMMAGWSIGCAVLFSCFSGKETCYLISSYPAWGILLAWGWSALPSEGLPNAYRQTIKFAVKWMLPTVIYIGALAVILIFHPATTYAIGYLFYGLLIIGIVNINIANKRQNTKWMLFAIFITLLGFKGFWSETYMVERQISYPYPKIGREISEALNEDETMICVGIYRAFIQFYVQHPFQHVESWADFKKLEAEQKLEGRYLLITKKKLPIESTDEYPLMNRWKTKRNEFLFFKIDEKSHPENSTDE